MLDRALFLLQRLTAMALAPLVLVHLGLILVASRDGLTAAEILGRTQGSTVWAVFYGAFGPDKDVEVKWGHVRFDKIAEGYGAYGEYVDRTEDIAPAVVAGLTMDPRGFIPELAVFATNPF